jgi:hypothetical protein
MIALPPAGVAHAPLVMGMILIMAIIWLALDKEHEEKPTMGRDRKKEGSLQKSSSKDEAPTEDVLT